MTAPTSELPILEDEDLPPIITTRRPRRTSPVRVVVSAVVALSAIGFLVSKGLGSATVYFKTADEAVAQRRQLGTHRFRIEGSVQAGTLRQDDGRLLFVLLGEQGAVVPVVHTGGQPTGLFKESIPVVLEGHFDRTGAYDSDRIIVKHSETYRAQNPGRVADYVPPPGSSS